MEKKRITTNKIPNKNLVLNKYKRQLVRDGIRYKLGLITKKYVFYYDPNNEDVIMMDRNLKIISDNYFGLEEYSNQLAKLFPKKGWVWADNNSKYNAEQIYKDYKDNDML